MYSNLDHYPKQSSQVYPGSNASIVDFGVKRIFHPPQKKIEASQKNHGAKKLEILADQNCRQKHVATNLPCHTIGIGIQTFAELLHVERIGSAWLHLVL